MLVSAARAADAGFPVPRLVEVAIDNWIGESEHWAFTQRAVEYDDGKPHERLERYDPSQPVAQRWTLLKIDGQPPTAEQQAAWAKKKAKHRSSHRFESPVSDFFEFQKARVVAETPDLIRCEVPLRGDRNWLFQSNKVKVFVTVNKKTRALDHLSANVREPVKVLFGIAKVTDGALDLSFHDDDPSTPASSDATHPTGSVHMTVSKFGERAEFTWSEFKRVGPVADAK